MIQDKKKLHHHGQQDNELKGNRAFADLGYCKEYNISPSTLIFAATKG